MRRVLLLLLLLMFAGNASAADKYLATTGNDGNTGTSIAQAWLTPTYAMTNMDACSTLWVVDGTYVSATTIEIEANKFGSAGAWTKVKAYNGTPIFDGNSANVDGMVIGESSDPKYTSAYVEVDGIHIKRFNQSEIYLRNVCNVVIRNCTFANSSVGLPTWRSNMKCGTGVCNITIDNCSFIDSGNFGIDLMGDRYSGTAIAAYNITISDCYFETAQYHSACQIADHVYDITIEGCTVENCYGGFNTYFHEKDNLNYSKNIIFRNNKISNITAGYAISMIKTHDSIIDDNVIYNCVDGGKAGISLTENCDNATVENNTVEWVLYAYDDAHSGAAYPAGSNGLIIYKDNTFTNITARTEGDWEYYLRAGGMLYIKDCDHLDASGDSTMYCMDLRNDDAEGNTTIEKTDGQVFSYDISGSTYWLNPPRWYPAIGNMSFGSAQDVSVRVNVTDYAVTLVPTNAYLKDVTVNHESDVADDRTNVSVNSSVTTNPAQIGATMQNATNTYNVSIDGVYDAQVVSSAAKVATYQYSASWNTPHSFEFVWYSTAGFSGAPDPTNIQNTVGTTWVHHTWSAGSGNVTDSYNVSVNSVWHNASPAYYNNTGMAGGAWSNVTVWAYNNTGGISQNSISQNTQNSGGGGGWTPSIFGQYYNTANPILITTKGYGDFSNLFNRTPLETDGNATSGRLVVTTS